MGYSNTSRELPDWDPETQALVDKHKGHREVVVAQLVAGLPATMPMTLEKLQTIIRESFDSALEAVAHDLT